MMHFMGDSKTSLVSSDNCISCITDNFHLNHLVVTRVMGTYASGSECIMKIKPRSFNMLRTVNILKNEKGDGPYRGFGYLILFSGPID